MTCIVKDNYSYGLTKMILKKRRGLIIALYYYIMLYSLK